LWCKNCNREAFNKICDTCGNVTEQDIPIEIYWCSDCKVPVIKLANAIDKTVCPLCGLKTTYLCVDLRPVFPEERLLYEILTANPLEYINQPIWVSDNRYYIDGKSKMLPISFFGKVDIDDAIKKLDTYQNKNSYYSFNEQIGRFVLANKERLEYLKNEAASFIHTSIQDFPQECIVISFSGGKDSTVVADLVVRSLSNPCLVHIFGDTTLEFPLTIEYVKRFRANNPKAIFKIAKNKEQDFYSVCNDIGPPARMMRWCCSMFKTGPIAKVLNNLYPDTNILTFYGIRKCESVTRSKYKRTEDSAESIKIRKQTVASPIFLWRDIDVWLYILSEGIDFNDAYRLGYDRVGCWCCPNNNARGHFLSMIYMPEQSKKWRTFLIDFAKRIGKNDAEVYVDTGKWKARQGGYGVESANDIKIKYTNCTTEENSKIYRLNKPISSNFFELFIPFGKVSKELGRKLINEVIVLDINTNVPILSIQPFKKEGYEYSIKIKTMNVKDHEGLQRMVSYQIRKYNACRKCLKCRSLCMNGAISINNDIYSIDEEKCIRCKMCITSKYLDKGCLMNKYLFIKNGTD
jgi:phosphoadenosine phosphosulfate reductase